MKGIAILGASGGLGRAVAARLAKRAPVTLGYLTREAEATRLASELTAAGGRAVAARVDVRDGASVQAFLDGAVADWGGLAGIASVTGPAIPLCPLLEVAEADFRRILETDVMGAFNVLTRGMRVLGAGGGGAITLFLTTAVLRTLENDGMSGVPKTGVAGLLRQAARESGALQVRINGVAPGVIDAGIVHSSFEVSDTARAVIDDCLAKTPLKRLGRPGEVAALVDYLMGDEAGYVHGQIVAIDGGYSA